MGNFLGKKVLTGFLSGLVCLMFIEQGFCQDSSIVMNIHLTKKVFIIAEPIAGEIVMESSIPTTYFVNFKIEIYKEDALYADLFTKAPAFFGETKYELEKFGIPEINTGPESEGRWRIVISTQGNPPATAEVEFVIEHEKE